MIERINKYECIYNKIDKVIKKLEKDFDSLKKEEENIKSLNEYYGSSEWFYDLDMYDNNKIEKVNAMILSEDGVWNLLERLNELKSDMKDFVNKEY